MSSTEKTRFAVSLWSNSEGKSIKVIEADTHYDAMDDAFDYMFENNLLLDFKFDDVIGFDADLQAEVWYVIPEADATDMFRLELRDESSDELIDFIDGKRYDIVKNLGKEYLADANLTLKDEEFIKLSDGHIYKAEWFVEKLAN